MTSWSLANRLCRDLLLGLMGLWLATAGFVAWSLSNEIGEAFDRAMRETAQRLLPLAEERLHEHDENEMSLVFDSSGHDGATLAYNQLTIGCVQCHKIVRDARK